MTLFLLSSPLVVIHMRAREDVCPVLAPMCGDHRWGASDIDAMNAFVSSSQARNTVIIEVSKCVHGLLFYYSLRKFGLTFARTE